MVVLPSSPVWYQSRGMDSSHDGILAFGSRNLVYTLNLRDKRPEIYGILSGHTDKVTSCSFCPPANQGQLLRIASGAEDCTVKVWDVQQKLMLQEHTAHRANKIVTVHWSPGDEKGFVICWNLESGSTDRLDPDGSSQVNLCCLTCSPHDENIVAVGYRSGAVSLIDIARKGNVVRKLRAHTNEVHGIVWMPKKNENLFQKDSRPKEDGAEMARNSDGYQGIIVTGSKDKTIRLWSISKGKCMRNFRVPARLNKGRKVNEEVARLYTTVYWPPESDDKFISSGYNGDLILWNLDPEAENLFEILANQRHDAGHQRIVFNICHGMDPQNSIVTTSMDRQIFHWTIPDLKPTGCSGPDWILPTLGGFVYCISVSPNDPSVVAVGVGDGMIRVWRTKSSRSAYDIVTLWQGIKEKVMSLAWHPQKEGCLAYATEDGKVGVYDVLSMRPPVVAETYHLKPVYALSWGPKCITKSGAGDKAGDLKVLNIYSCGGDGIIFQHDSKNMSSDAINIDNIIEENNAAGGLSAGKHSEVSWSPNGAILAIGNDNGHIATIKCHSKVVNCVCWKPVEDDKYEIATGSNNSTVLIHDLGKIFLEHNYKVGDTLGEPILISRASKSLVGHLSRITGLSYNTRNPSEIVSSSYDGTAQVWNIEMEKPLYNFRGHHGRLMCAVWTSVIDDTNNEKMSGIIYTGADDYTVHGWYAEDQQHTEPVKTLPDFGFGPKNKFQSKKKVKQKKDSQAKQARCSSQNSSESTQNPLLADNWRDSNLDQLLEKRKAELLASMDCDDAKSSLNASLPALSSSPSANEKHTASLPVPELFHEVPIAGKYGEEPGKKMKKRLKNMFPQSVSMDNRKKSYQHQDCLKVVQWKASQMNFGETQHKFIPGEPEHINLGFYTDRRAAFRMMKNEERKLQEQEHTEGSLNIKLWMGDVVGAINDAASLGHLTDQLVAMAPMAGQNFWRETAYKFAQQLIVEGHHLHAVQYLLVCNKVCEAVDVLVKGRHYREAVALARARFCEDDPVLKKTVRAWALKLKSGGSVELAAKCFASIGEFEEAASVLSQRATSGSSNITDNDIASLWAAASIAKSVNKIELASGYANRALSSVCIRNWNWKDNAEILSSFSNLEAYRFISLVHEILVNRLVLNSGLTELKSTNKSFEAKDIAGSTFVESILCEWKKRNELEIAEKNSTGLSESVCLDIVKEANDHSKSPVTQTRLLFLLSIVLSASVSAQYFCAHLRVDQHKCSIDVEESDNAPLEQDWGEYLMRSVAMLSASRNCARELQNEVMKMICEIVNWSVIQKRNKEVSSLCNGSNDESNFPPGEQDAMKFLLRKAVGRYDHLQSFLKDIVVT